MIFQRPADVATGALRHPPRELGGAVEARELRQRRRLVVGGLRPLLCHRGRGVVDQDVQRLQTLVRIRPVLRPSDEEALRQALEVVAVFAGDAGVRAEAEHRHGRTAGARAHRRLGDRLGAQHRVQAAPIQAVGHVVLPLGFAQHRRARQQREVVAVDVQRPVVVDEGLLRVAGVVQQVGLGLVHVDEAGDVVDAVERPPGAGQVAAAEQHAAEVDVHLRRQRLAQADEPPAVNQVPLGVAAAGAEAAEAGVGRGQRHQLAQHRRAAQAGLRERVLQRQELALGVADFLRDVGQQAVEVELAVAPGDALQNHPVRPAEGGLQRRRQLLVEGAGADHVDDAVHGDDEGVVVGRVFGGVLQQRNGFVAPPGVLHQIRHQQQVVAVLRLLHQGAAVAGDGLVAEAAQGEDAGLELAGDALLVEGAQTRQPALYLAEALVRILRQVVREHVEHDVLHMLQLVLGVHPHQLAEHAVVGVVIGHHAVHLP